MFNLQGEKDWLKYEKARDLKGCVDKIRANYREDWKSKEMRIRQRAVALYFIDKVRSMKFNNEHLLLKCAGQVVIIGNFECTIIMIYRHL